MYEEYARRLAEFSLPGDAPRFEIRLFRRRADYLRLTGDRFTNTGGIFISNRNLLAIYLEEQGRENLRRTLQHEAFHQFAFTNISPELPIWLNEGLAQVFEEGIFVGDQFRLGQVPPRRLRQLQFDQANRRLTDFRGFLGTTDEQWTRNLRDRTRGASQYNQAWAMTHFLIFAQRDGQPVYRARLLDWLRRMNRGEDAKPSFTTVFGANVDGFQARFTEFAQTLQPTQHATFLENQNVLADLLITLKNDGKGFKTIEAFRNEIVRGRYRINYTRDQIQWTTAADPAVYFADPAGKPYTADRLRFEPAPGAPLPDLVCVPDGTIQVRTRFYILDGKLERETIVEVPKG